MKIFGYELKKIEKIKGFRIIQKELNLFKIEPFGNGWGDFEKFESGEELTLLMNKLGDESKFPIMNIQQKVELLKLFLPQYKFEIE